ncbi:MAG: hypothetical protein IKZ57_00420 [Spirochaetia bacterium]|nr:hypothetical protein [Spirochaetia bacterium]
MSAFILSEKDKEIEVMLHRVIEWASNTLDIKWAEGKSLLECEERFGNILEAIAFLPLCYLPFFDGTAVDNRIYSSKGYFIDHIANHGHKDVGVAEYADLQKVFSYPDEVIKDTRKKPNGKNRDSLLFVKRFEKNRLAAIELSDIDGQIILHKSLYKTKDRVYPGLPRIKII